MSASTERAATFCRLHQDGLLVLANAWDAASARLIESLGAKAVATTSAGVAWSHGYPDGDQLPVRRLAETVAAITRIVKVPLSADVEGGYSADPAAVGEAVAAVVGAGAVGINIEDGDQDPDLLCAKIESAKRAATRAGVDLFVNARTDVYLRGLVPEDRRVETTLARAERYRAAGADGLFVPVLAAPAEIRAVAAGAGLPLNVMAWPGLPPASELMRLGVRRLSAGSSIAQAALAQTGLLAAAFLQTGASEAVRERGIPYAEINALMAE
jgi:2-methylisocitrate lyase-like PEP mutase family enzyme